MEIIFLASTHSDLQLLLHKCDNHRYYVQLNKEYQQTVGFPYCTEISYLGAALPARAVGGNVREQWGCCPRPLVVCWLPAGVGCCAVREQPRELLCHLLTSGGAAAFTHLNTVRVQFNSRGSFQNCSVIAELRVQVPFSMAIENVELMHECCPQHLPMGTARTKKDKETDGEGKQKRVNGERSTAGRKKMSWRPTLNSGILLRKVVTLGVTTFRRCG